MHDVAVGHNVVLALEPHFARVARSRFAPAPHVVVVSDGFSADEAALEIGVDGARGLWRLGAARHRPGARLLRPGSEKGHKVEERIAGADQAVEPGFLETDSG